MIRNIQIMAVIVAFILATVFLLCMIPARAEQFTTPAAETDLFTMPMPTWPVQGQRLQLNLDGYTNGLDVTWGGKTIHLTNEQIGHWLRILSHTCSNPDEGTCKP